MFESQYVNNDQKDKPKRANSKSRLNNSKMNNSRLNGSRINSNKNVRFEKAATPIQAPVKPIIEKSVVDKIKRNAARKERRREAIARGDLYEKAREHPEDYIGTHEYVDDVFSDWDLMVAAKHYPGIINAPYVGAMSTFPVPTGILRNCFTASSAFRVDDQTFQPMGTSSYVCFFFYPLATVMFGPGGPGNYGTTTKLGGLAIAQTSSGGNAVIGNSWFYQTNYGSSMVQTYGSDASSIASRAFIWASQLDIKIVAPAANIVGTYYEGVINGGQLAAGNLTVNQLIAIAQKVEGGKAGYTLRGSVVNHQLAFWQQSASTTDRGDNDLESIHYVILQTPVMSLTTGQTTSFSIIANVSSNYLLWPRPNDTFANSIAASMMNSSVCGAKSSAPPAIHQVNPMSEQKPGFAKWLGSLFNGDTIKSVVSSVLPTVVGAIAGGPVGAAGGLASSVLGGVGKSLLGSVVSKIGSGLFESNMNSSTNTGPLAGNNSYYSNIDPAGTARNAMIQSELRWRDDKAFSDELKWLKNLSALPSSPHTSSSVLKQQPMLQFKEPANRTIWISGSDVRYEIDKHLNTWNDWPGIGYHATVWQQIKDLLQELSEFYENVDRMDYNYVPPSKALRAASKENTFREADDEPILTRRK